MKNFKLHNNVEIPAIGFGTWQLTENVEETINKALDAGYKHIDTAAIYNNEKEIGQALKNRGVNRQDVFITSKVWASNRGYQETLNAFEESLKNLQTDYLDLYLIHWPAKTTQENWEQTNADTWRALEDLYNQGKVKAIGVSNFMKHHLDALKKVATIKPMVNQIEYHPGYLQQETVDFCQMHQILVQAWSPIGSGKLLQDSNLKQMAEKYKVSVAQLCIQFALQNNILPLPKSTNITNINSNLNFSTFKILDEDVNKLRSMQQTGFSGLIPDQVPF